ncbi:unnamed protein product, partial [marine sediment metagenome]
MIEAKREMPPALYDQEIECSYITEEEMVLITTALMEKLQGGHKIFRETRRIVSCDPSTGGDECPIQAIENGKIIEEVILNTNDVIYIAHQMKAVGQKHNIEDYILDKIGIGQGTWNECNRTGMKVIGFDSRNTAINEEKFCNRRVEAWWYAYEQIRDREIPYMEDMELRRQLSAVRYGLGDKQGRLGLEEKDKTKLRLGQSPDKADCFVMGQWGLKYVVPVGKERAREAE